MKLKRGYYIYNMKYGTIKTHDIANGPGVRVSVFVSGCRRNCKNCFNKDSQNFKYGNDFNEKTRDFILISLREHYISGLSILGGEPLEPENQVEVRYLIRNVKMNIKTKNIWLYTGYELYKDIMPKTGQVHLIKGDDHITMDILNNVDYIVDGPFIESLKNPDLAFRGSSNQHIWKRDTTSEKLAFICVDDYYDRGESI